MPAPQRTCIGCKRKGDQSEFLRLGRHGSWEATTGGRSAYVCRDAKCVSLALKPGRFERSFRQPVGSELREVLKEVLECKLR